MPLKLQTAVLNLIARLRGYKVENKTPDWLNRPGIIECGECWPLICKIYYELTELQLPAEMPKRSWRKLDGILNYCALPSRIIEFDEIQHFNFYREKTLELYPENVKLAFDRRAWLERSRQLPKQKSGKWAAPKPPLFPNHDGRHKQRAFRDAVADILPQKFGFLPTLRIAYFEVENWIYSEGAKNRMMDLLGHKMSDQSPPD